MHSTSSLEVESETEARTDYVNATSRSHSMIERGQYLVLPARGRVEQSTEYCGANREVLRTSREIHVYSTDHCDYSDSSHSPRCCCSLI